MPSLSSTWVQTYIVLITMVGLDAVDPDAFLTAPQIIARYNYPAESHTIVTEDGYLLTVHRIPHSKNENNRNAGVRQPVLLHHGLLATSTDFITAGEENSLAFILSRAGYDVWMGNARGNTYSQGHVKYTPSDYEFWDFSWDEMAKYDLPAVIDYIAHVTNQGGNILYVGHSMGTTIFFSLMASKPEYNHKIKAMFALAPVAFVGHIKSPIRYLAPWTSDVQWITRFLGVKQFIPNVKLLRFLAKYGCNQQTNIQSICKNVLFVICGFDDQQFNTTLLPVILNHTPAATSVRTVLHYGQEVDSGKFHFYDYGKEENVKRYGCCTPPEYNITNIKVPVALYYSENDWIAGPRDVDDLYKQLPDPIIKYKVDFEKFNHLDFLWAKNVVSLLYKQLVQHMKKYTID